MSQQEQQFPSLGGSNGLGSNYAGITSGQILRAKNTTHTANRSPGSRSVWARVEAAAASQPVNRPPPPNQRFVPGSRIAPPSSAAFPTLGGPVAAGPAGGGSGGSSSVRNVGAPHSTPWASGGAGSSSKTPSALATQIRSVNYATPKPGASSKPPSQAAFPSLPASAKPSMSAQERKALFSKPNAREETIRRITGSGSNTPATPQGWGSTNGTSEAVEALSLGDGQSEQPPTTGGSKKKGKQKQILFSVSARPQ